MDNLTPTAQATLNALRTGPGNVHELRERTGRSRSATDKALGELAKADLVVKVDGGDPGDGAPTRWQLAEPAPTDGDSTGPDSANPPEETPGQNPADDSSVEESGDSDGPSQPDAADAPEQPGSGPDSTEDATPAGDAAGQEGDDGNSNDAPGDDEQQAPGADEAPAEDEVKRCRGCQAQVPKICPCCWQKTPAFCGTCRQNMPQVRRGEPGEPQILSNGLPKLRPGELEQLVLKVMQDHPVPHHVGVTGWTSGRVAIFLPGRSFGAINNALEKLEKVNLAELIGDKPMRYQLKTSDTDGDREPPTDNADPATTNPATTDSEATNPEASTATE